MAACGKAVFFKFNAANMKKKSQRASVLRNKVIAKVYQMF